MTDRTSIEWTDATWNPVRGCSRVSAGCEHCYAERIAARFDGPGKPFQDLIHKTTQGWNGNITLVAEALEQPLRWRKPRRIFVNSMSDLFHPGVPDAFIDRVFAVMALAPQHTFQILTKRPERMRDYCASDDTFGRVAARCASVANAVRGVELKMTTHHDGMNGIRLENVWLGVSVEDQVTADERIPLLLQCPAVVRFLSCEPLLGPIDLRTHALFGYCPEHDFPGGFCIQRDHLGVQHIHWVIAGGESGPGARPMHPDWARSLRDQCKAAGVPFLFKQWGEYSDLDHLGERWNTLSDHRRGLQQFVAGKAMVHVGKRRAGRLLDGVEHNAFPEPSA